MNEVEHLTLEDLIRLTRRLGVGPVRDIGLLDAAVARTRSSAFGADAYPSVELKAAALLHSLVRNHGLVDGNKRLGWLATVVFLDINGLAVNKEDHEAFDLVIAVAEGRVDVEQIAAVLSADEQLRSCLGTDAGATAREGRR